MATKIWKNHNGEVVPAQYVPAIDKKKEKIAEKYYSKASKISEALDKLKSELLAECDAIYEEMCEAENVRTGNKGNYTVQSFDKSIKIEVNVQKRIEFDDKINLAQEKINQFLTEKSSGVDADLQLLINSAFQSSKGRLDTKRILGLFKHNIKHKTWLEAMELIKKSIDTNTSKRYVRIFAKDTSGEYKSVELNFSSL